MAVVQLPPAHVGPWLAAAVADGGVGRGDDLVVALVAAVATIMLGAQAQVLLAAALGDRVAREAGRTWHLGARIDRTGTLIVPGLLALASGVAVGWAARPPIRRDALDAPRRVLVGLTPSLVSGVVAVVVLLVGRRSAAGAGQALLDESTAATVAAVAVLQAAFWLLPAPPLPGGEVVAALLRDDRREAWERLARGPVAPWGLGAGALVVVTGVGDVLRGALGG